MTPDRRIRRYFRRYGPFWEFTLPLVALLSMFAVAIWWEYA